MTAADRVTAIEDQMRAGDWHGRPSIEQRAAEWGLTPSTVRNYSTEASRRARASLDCELLRSQALDELDEAAEMARDKGDPGAMARVAAERAKIAGPGGQPHRVQVEVGQRSAASDAFWLTEGGRGTKGDGDE